MPAYNFQKQFAPKILNGSKAQTIRRRRKRATIEGDTLSLYVGQRTKSCRLIGRAPCIKVTPIIIFPFFYLIGLDGFAWGVKSTKVKLLALNDGFETIKDFFDFFTRYQKYVLDNFEIIEWDPEQLEVENAA